MLRIGKMVKKHHVKGWEEFEKLVTGLESEKKKQLMFFSRAIKMNLEKAGVPIATKRIP